MTTKKQVSKSKRMQKLADRLENVAVNDDRSLRINLYFYERLSSASPGEEPQVLYNFSGNSSTVLCLQAG